MFQNQEQQIDWRMAHCNDGAAEHGERKTSGLLGNREKSALESFWFSGDESGHGERCRVIVNWRS